jgi:hypothetical protein
MGDAIQEAGFAPNIMQKGFSDEILLEQYARLAQRLSRLPVQGELIRESKANASFPSEKVFRRFRGKQRLLSAVAEFCLSKPGYDDVLRLCEDALKVVKSDAATPTTRKIRTGFVYLIKSGRHYKIGRTNSLPRRNWELGIKLPIPPRAIHHIETDDPTGIEAYWHKRFEEKRGEGEWFNLNSDDVMAFKRWKRIV